jgi:hypothetical protein
MNDNLLPNTEAVFLSEFGREMNLFERNIVTSWMRKKKAWSHTGLMDFLREHIARQTAVELMALPNIVHADPVVVNFGSPSTGKKFRPAAEYVDEDARHALYIVGVQPKHMTHYALDTDGNVFSHGYQVDWATTRDPRYQWAWPMGACWLTSIYSSEQFDAIYEYDPENKPTVFDYIKLHRVHWLSRFMTLPTPLES